MLGALSGLGAAIEMAVADGARVSVAFQLRASHGYTLRVFAFSERPDGRGNVLVLASKPGLGVTYLAPATVTAEAIEASLGQVGRIDVRLFPLEETAVERSSCGEGPLRFPAGVFRGQIEFHGMEGFAEASATQARLRVKPIADLVCPGRIEGEVGGDGLSGARLKVRLERAGGVLELQVNKNHPPGRTSYSAELAERRGKLSILRRIFGTAPSTAFSYAPGLGTATLAPPAPFSGAATFHARAPHRNRWTGGLTVDFPGHSNVRLAGARADATLVPARRLSGRRHR